MRMEIGAYDAKTRLPELLRQVTLGKRLAPAGRRYTRHVACC